MVQMSVRSCTVIVAVDKMTRHKVRRDQLSAVSGVVFEAAERNSFELYVSGPLGQPAFKFVQLAEEVEVWCDDRTF